MNKDRVTVIDIARAAGVSKSTVSLVLQASPLVNEATRAKVNAVIRELGYVYNRGAANLRQKSASSRIIGIIVNDLTNSFFAELAVGMDMVMQSAGYVQFLSNSAESVDRQREVIAGLRAHGTAPDLPPELAPFLALFAASGSTADLSRIDRDQSILLAHLYGEEGMPWLTRFYARLAAPDLLEAGTDLAERFEALGDSPLAPRGATEGAPPSSDISTEARSTQRTKDASQQAEIETLVEEFMTRFAPVLEEFFAAEPEPQLGDGASMFTAYEADSLSDAQREVLARVGRRLD